MIPEDSVTAIFVFGNNFVPVRMSRKDAAKLLESWWLYGQWFQGRSFFRRAWERFHNWLKGDSLFGFLGECDDGTKYCQAVVNLRHVVGVYLREDQVDSQAILAQAQSKIAKVLEDQQKRMDEGDNWREGPKDDDEDVP